MEVSATFSAEVLVAVTAWSVFSISSGTVEEIGLIVEAEVVVVSSLCVSSNESVISLLDAHDGRSYAPAFATRRLSC